MEEDRERCLIEDEYGNRKIARKKPDGEYEYLSDYVGHLAWDLVDDFLDVIHHGKTVEGTDLELKINALNALANAASLERL